MALPLDNPGSVALRAPVDSSAARSEPVFEFARKKSPSHVADGFDDREPLGGLDASERDFAPLRVSDLLQVSLPRDSAKPLVTSSERHAKEALESYKSLRTRLLKSHGAPSFRSIAVTSVARSEGKTLTAFNLACCCAQVAGLSVLLIDGDLRNRSLSKLIGRLPSIGLAEVMSGAASCEDAVVRTDLPNLFVMGAGSAEVSPTELFSTDRWSQVVRWSEQQFRIVVVDALSIGAFADFELIAPECDGVLLVVRARSTPREALKTAIDQIDPEKLLGVVWNGSES